MRGFLLCAALSVACNRGAHGSKSLDPALAHGAPAASPSVPLVPIAPVPTSGYPALVRAERWSDARAALEALPENERAKPEWRFVHARVTHELGDAETAVRDLDSLEHALPALANEIALARARAELRAGPFADAAQFFDQRADTDSLLCAASAYLSANSLVKARSAVERALSRIGKSKHLRDSEVRARALRAQIAEAANDQVTARLDYRWLALSAPLHAEADSAAEALERAGGVNRLSKSEREGRASAFAEAGRIAATESELSALESAPGAPLPVGRVTYLRAFAIYAARADYEKAATLFERAAREDPVTAVKSLFFAARSLSRAQADDRAIAGYERVVRQFPKTAWAEQAQYLSARLRFIAGDFNKARSLYDVYLAEFGRAARFGSDASYERALCALETDQPAAAALSFERLADHASERRAKARLHYLAALSLGLANQKAKAVAAFEQVARDEPLSFFGLAARARLSLVGAELPPLITDAKSAAKPALALGLPEDVALLNRLGLSRDAERELARQESRVSREFAPRGTEALCESYGVLGVAERRYRLGQDAVRGEALDAAPNGGNGWAWRCLYPSPYLELVAPAAAREKLSPSLIYAVMRQESAFDPSATSPAKAFGLLQLIAPTARRVADGLHQPFQESELLTPDGNIRYGARYLAQLSGYFSGNLALVAAAYNAGPDAVFRWLSAPEKIGMDVFVARIPFEETRAYVDRVLGNLARYQYLEGGAAAVSVLNLDLPHATRPDDIF
ncbi:MAG TPA: transglycosylase SLT domain-containing protein [Polyangiaceae bacterium]|nr:transglycosylase SLT domain-containing protein [Polyangiaceae bacterium]